MYSRPLPRYKLRWDLYHVDWKALHQSRYTKIDLLQSVENHDQV